MGLRDLLSREPISNLPLREAPVVERGASVRDAMLLMRQRKLGCVYLLDDGGRPTAMFSERLLVRLLARDAAQLDKPVQDHAIPVRCMVKLTDPIQSMIKEMSDRDIRFVCVVDDDGKLAGLTGQRGIMEYIAERFPRQVKVHQLQSKLHMDQREGA